MSEIIEGKARVPQKNWEAWAMFGPGEHTNF